MEWDQRETETSMVALLGALGIKRSRLEQRHDSSIMDTLQEGGPITDRRVRHEPVHLADEDKVWTIHQPAKYFDVGGAEMSGCWA